MPATGSVIVSMPGSPPFEVRLDRDVSVGRAEDNEIALRDMNVSRHHFAIERQPNHYLLKDKNSRNGTLVNDVSVMHKVLVDGDRVVVGSSELTFRAEASAQAMDLTAIPRPTPTRRSSAVSSSSVKPRGVRRTLRTGEAQKSRLEPATRHKGSQRLKGQPTDQGVIEKDGTEKVTTPAGDERWRKLAEVACAINGEHDIDTLLERILEAVLSLVPSNSACLVLREGEQLRVAASHNAENPGIVDDGEGSSSGYRLSRQICLEAIAQRRPVLTQDAVGDEKLGQFLSVLNLRLKSILCVPFSSTEDVLGVVYLDEPKQDLFSDDGELVSLVGAFGELAGIALANARLMSEIASRERLEEELRIAAQIQARFLPTQAPQIEGLELAGRTKPARSVGGDLFDFIRREHPAREVLVSIGDVAGKGVGAGLVMGTVRSLLRAYAEVLLGTDEIVARMNAHLNRDLDAGMFVSFLLLRYSEETGQLAFTGAGHEHLILYRPATQQLEFMRAGGVVLGLVSDIAARVSERRMTLQPGDVVCLYTDGATEARDPSGEEFGLERIGEAVKSGPLDPASVVDRVMRLVQQFTGDDADEFHDDLTIVALRKV